MKDRIGHCKQCGKKTKLLLHIQLFVNGSENYLWVCDECKTRNPERSQQFYIPSGLVKKHVTEEELKTLPVIPAQFYTRCARCGSRNTEVHHWAPKGLFGEAEAENWPQAYLCKDCHDQWHRMVTPALVQIR